MNDETRRVTANLPKALLAAACRSSGEGITDTIVRGLELVKRQASAEKAKELKGKLKLDLNLDESRERARH